MKCPNPLKRRFSYRGALMAAHHSRTFDALRPYRCRCGLWHLTSKP